MLAGREEGEAGIRWLGSVETEWREVTKPARGASSRWIVYTQHEYTVYIRTYFISYTVYTVVVNGTCTVQCECCTLPGRDE
jgi:hypothetical protein